MPHFTHAAAYHFATLSDLKPLRQDLITRCKSLGIKGTILISTEGVNLFISGQRGDVDALLDHLRTLPGLARLTPKYNPCDHQPYNRMLVRIKKEIIAFGVDGVDPAKRTSPKLSAKDLKQWLDEGRPVTLLDTRNDYEIKLGTFKNAIPIGVDT
ncbi:MAG: pseudouridine synthase, partial [Verrucomicrobiales bacterium]|nr:pseudouridine synthase [Verrucomicrobiales bacterium]